MTDRLLTLINEKYPITEIDCGEFANMSVKGMKFSIRAYKAEGLGHVSIMRGSAMMGLMKMDTLIINPTELDLPLYSYDRIFALGNDTLIVELYDTLVGKYSEDEMLTVKGTPEYTAIPERDPGEHWYDYIKLQSSISKKGKKKHLKLMNELTEKHFAAYFAGGNTPVADGEAKRDKAGIYVNGLIEKGGPSTDVFKGAIGEAKTRKLFESVLFGTK